MKNLGAILQDNGITQAEFAAGIDMSESFVSQLVSGDAHPSEATINSTLAFLCKRLGHVVTYEQLSGSPEACK